MDGSSSNLYSNKGSRGLQRKLLASDKSEISNDDDKKKLMHRDIERQRRQEMATLYASLRTLLPLEYIKGKRAISDHMHGAVSYIKDLQNRIDELNAKRDELKKLSSSSGFDQGTSSNDSCPSSAVVRQSFDGVEVLIRTGLGAQALTLSRVLELLLEEGLDVVSCISTRIDGGLIHTIQSEVSDLTCVDVPGLERKLNEEISSLNRISSY
ncbi:transcription factor bHLH126-like [Durio zibethinus]|uniref:Transcription factor bHLH126-like n=1 Tax=Durio zibethinus TaxID=66656 RepID=A0A6P5Y3I1_DURZI|nr:transcription factor bHLH126-like [Durio zibethinus]